MRKYDGCKTHPFHHLNAMRMGSILSLPGPLDSHNSSQFVAQFIHDVEALAIYGQRHVKELIHSAAVVCSTGPSHIPP